MLNEEDRELDELLAELGVPKAKRAKAIASINKAFTDEEED